ncbi:MAG: gfo/Idh/MocA family oxidoreductase [Calditrichaeota bacterium]|nr:MAG: gfo/Idh/MocA family oxidoreductase [Calditrichota bacterium]
MTPELKPPVRIGVVGCGGVAQIVHLPNLINHEHASVEALCDIDTRKAAIVANRFGIKNIYGDIEEMLNHHKLDAVFILTPTNMHLPMSLMALRHKLHVFIEKPVTRNAREAHRILETAKKNNCVVMVGMHSRFRDDIIHLNQLLEEDQLGDIFMIKSDWFQAHAQFIKQPWLSNKNISGGGVLLDLGIQLLDTSWWLAKKPRLKTVKAIAKRMNPNSSVEDFCHFVLTFTNDLIVSCHISWSFPIPSDRFHAEIYTTNGYCTLNPFRIERMHRGKFNDITPKVPQNGATLFQNTYRREVDHFIQYLIGETDTLDSPLEDACLVMEMIDAIYESIATGNEIHLPLD